VKKNKRIKRAAGADTPAEEQRSQESRADKERKARILQLQEALAVCPGDILARYALATLQEEVGQPDEALFNWRAVLASNPNSLQAREGVARCREQISRILSSDVWGKTRVFDAGRC
jgi:cytochrome c-type biogenesis protein CcmH/NrfG